MDITHMCVHNVNNTKTIAILGGAFNPPHVDHLRMAYECLNWHYCDEVWFMPSPQRWDKQVLIHPEHRLQMIQKAIEGVPEFVLCSLELEQKEFRGSYFFLKQLARLHPEHHFRLVIGADTYQGILEWRDPLTFTGNNYNGIQLLQEFELIVLPRPGFASPNSTMHQNSGYADLFSFSHAQFFAALGQVSSSQIRERVFQNKNTQTIRGLVPETVREYIEKNQLYL
jgi:nicotinate-nucleotide adenylyltransferase